MEFPADQAWDPGSAMDPSHTFRTLVIEMLRGDASARQDLVQAFGDLNQGNTFESPRLLYFLLENCKMDKLNKLPEFTKDFPPA